jgi:YVTN family beta-propeller protein
VFRILNVGDEPRSVAVDPNDQFAYVANAAGNSVTVIKILGTSPFAAVVESRLTTGAEPWDVVISPDGKRVYVANAGQDTLTVIRADVASPSVIDNIDLAGSACNTGDANRHFQPRGLAVTLDNTRLYVARFLSFTKAGGAQADDLGKEGVICRLDLNTSAVTGAGSVTAFTPVTLAAQDTGFRIDRDNDTVPDPTFAYPNQLQSLVIRGNRVYAPNIAASPSGPLKFNVDTQAFVNVIGGATGASQTDLGALNLHLGARDPEPGRKRLFFSNPWAIAFTTQSGAGNAYVVSAGSDLLVKLNVDASGVLTFTGDVSTTRAIDLNDPANPATSGASAGKNPQGIAIRDTGIQRKAYVMNYVSRNVSVVDLYSDQVVKVIPLTSLPPAGTQDEQLQVGKEMFFSSRGHFDDPGGATASLDDRLSSEGWQNCASCHFAGLTDGNIWAFAAGPRKSVPMNGTFSPHNPDDQRLLNYSAIFDEVQDFEINIRNVSGPGALAGGALDPHHGLLISDTGGINAAPAAVNAFALPNAGRPQHAVRLPGSATAWPALDALKEWARFGIRTPNGALTTAELTAGGGSATGGSATGGINVVDVVLGRRLFFQAGCQACHGGTKWSVSSKDFASPPAGAEIATEAGAAGTVAAQFLPRFLSDIGSFNLNVPGQGNPITGTPAIGAPERNERGLNALGKDHNGDGQGDGYNVPSLLGIWHVPPYYHNGACETLACVLDDPVHRAAGGQSDPLSNAVNRNRLAEFLKTLDAGTEFPLNLIAQRHDIFVDPPTIFKGQQVVVGANLSLFGTTADLAALLEDVGQTTLTARFQLNPGATTIDVTFPVTAFRQNFGQAVVTTTWSVPNAAGIGRITVSIDPAGHIPEAAENDNAATRLVLVRNPPPDTTPPSVSLTRISDDAPFNDDDAVVTTSNVRVKIVAVDPPSPAPAPASGLAEYCIVRYTFDAALRRWVEEPCVFRALPAPEPSTTGTFIIPAVLSPRAGVSYAFAWVKDAAGNISRTPGFDVVSFIPATQVGINRNDVRLFRLPLAAGQVMTLTVVPAFGDVDVSVFDDFTNPNASRIALSANNGTLTETVTLFGPGRRQVEIRAVVNSQFNLVVAQGTGLALAEGAPRAPDAEAPATPLIAGPPALQTAIDDWKTHLPLVAR